MNRDKDLNRCLSSVFDNLEKPDEVIVSDDSIDSQPTQVVVAKYPEVIYQKGPRRGLSSNRNACIKHSQSSHIIFIDDDVYVPPEFFATARKIINSYGQKTIITGYEMKHLKTIQKIVPHNADFWGLQRLPVENEYRAKIGRAHV